MRVPCKYHSRWIGQMQFGGDMCLGSRPQFAHHPIPFVIGKAGRILPSRHLSDIACVGPEMMTVRGKMQPVWRCRQRTLEQVSPIARRWQAHNSVLNDQSSGKARLPKVDCR